MTRTSFVLAFACVVVACGGDDASDTGNGGSSSNTNTSSTTSTGAGGDTGTTSTTSSTSSTSTSTTTTGTGGGTTTTTNTGGGGTGGAGGGNSASPEATAFCNEYETTCGFGTAGYFASMAECLDSYDNVFDAARRACVEMHLGYAAQEPATHCPHAAGAAPCN